MANTTIGDYQLQDKLGEGGMGAVFKARQISLDRVVALKILPQRLAKNKDFIERFMREARATAKLNHPNIISGIDVGFAAGYYYFAMEYVNGESLMGCINRKKVLPEAEVIRTGIAMAEALAHAHSHHLIHRDVKPDNILIAPDGTPKLADLGLAKACDEAEDTSLTKTGTAVGTPHYLAPEQARGEKDLDGRVDTYALGCTLYHAATGCTPFEGATSAVLMVKHMTEKMPHPQSINPKLSDAFCAVLAKMLARNRDDRYAKLDLAVQDFQAIESGMPIKSPLSPLHVNFLPHKTAHRGRGTGEEIGAGIAASNRAIRHAAPVQREESVESHRTTPAKNRQPMWLWAFGGVAVALAVIAFMFFGRKNNGREKALVLEKSAEKAPVLPEPPKNLPLPLPAPPAPLPAPTLQAVANKPVSDVGWKPLFDGKSINVIRSASFDAWQVVDGAIVNVPGKFNAAQTVREFTDGMLRMRFSVDDVKLVFFNIRQGPGGFISVLDRNALNSYSGGSKDFELIYKMHGGNVTATLNGKDMRLQKNGDPRRGCLQFNCDGKLMRITALEFKDSVGDEF